MHMGIPFQFFSLDDPWCCNASWNYNGLYLVEQIFQDSIWGVCKSCAPASLLKAAGRRIGLWNEWPSVVLFGLGVAALNLGGEYAEAQMMFVIFLKILNCYLGVVSTDCYGCHPSSPGAQDLAFKIDRIQFRNVKVFIGVCVVRN